MLEDKLLILRCKRGSTDALCRIYIKYKDYLLTLAKALLNDKAAAEDVVHDVFVSFVESVEKFQLTGSLKSYLAICTRNLAFDRRRAGKRRTEKLDAVEPPISASDDPAQKVIEKEQSQRLRQAIGQLPYEQREVVVLHLTGRMKFRQIAKLQETSVSTVHGRYRYGLDKLRSLLNSEVEK